MFIRIANFIKGWHGGVAPLEVFNVVFKVDLTVYGFYNPVRRVKVFIKIYCSPRK